MHPPYLDLKAFKERFDPLLLGMVHEKVSQASAYSQDPYIAELVAYVEELTRAGGKRVRPYVAYLMYQATGGSDESVLQSLAALELFHIFALIHDDVIDRGALRHGIPTLHEYALSLTPEANAGALRVGDAQAILVGDLVFNWSKEIFHAHTRGAEGAAALALFDQMIYAVVVGQMLDTQMMCLDEAPLAKILEKSLLKTSAYTFVYPMRIGAALAGKDDEFAAFADEFGRALGMAYQLQDDLIDIIGSAKDAGKKTQQDVTEGQHTIFTAYVYEHANADDRSQLARIAHGEEEVSAEGIVAFFERTGALAHGRAEIAKEFAHAREALAASGLPEDARAEWERFIALMEVRTA